MSAPDENASSLTRQKVIGGGAVGLLAAVLALTLHACGVFAGVENVFWSWRARTLAKPSAVTPSIEIISVDDPSLLWVREQTGLSWPWPRELYGYLLSFCQRGGAASVTADFLFEQPGTVADDQALGDAIRNSPPFIAAFSLSNTAGTQEPIAEPLRRFFVPLPSGLAPDAPQLATLRFDKLRWPIPEVLSHAAALGNVTAASDAHGMILHTLPVRLYQDCLIPSLALAAATAGETILATTLPNGETILRAEPLPRPVPLTEDGGLILRYRGGSHTFQTYAAAAILQSELQLREGKTPLVDPGRLRGKRVILGISATGGTGGYDLKPTPVSPAMSGTEINATAVDNLLAGDWIERPGALPVALAFLLSAAFLGAAGGRFSLPWQNLLLMPLSLALLWGAGLAAYAAGFWWPVAAHGAGLLATLIATMAYHYATEGRRRKFIQNAFMHYLSPQVIARLMEHPEQLRLGGERRSLTIFFSDLAGFTSISETMPPEKLTQLLNEYLGEMTDIILDNGGTLDKYEGDAIIAFWNAPIGQPDHALRGVRAAMLCQTRLAERRDEWHRRFGSTLHMRIGLHTGDAIVGNMGSQRRFDYTMLGDAPNLASRLEGVNKIFGTEILVSETTRQATETQIRYQAVGTLRVVGRNAPIGVHFPYALMDEPAEKERDELSRAVTLRTTGDPDEANRIFRQYPAHPVARSYLGKPAEELIGTDGIWNLTHK